MLAAALLSAAASAASAQGDPSPPPATRPATATTQPAEGGTTVTITGAPPAAAPVKAIADRLTITDIDRTVLDAVRDDTKQIDETGLYVGFGIAARAALKIQLDPSEDDWSQLDRPAYVSLLAEPKRWRARPLQLTASVYGVTKLKSGEGLNYNEFWPKDSTVWQMDCVLSDNKTHPEQPIIIFSVVNPAEFLGLGEPGDSKGETVYKKGPQVRVAAIFYKDLLRAELNNGPLRLYPIVMAWQIRRTDVAFAVSGGRTADGFITRAAPVAILLVALVGGFYLLRRRMMLVGKGGSKQGLKYQPLRSPAPEAGGPKDATGKPEDAYVNPELAAAVEQFHHEHPKGHDETEGTAGASGKNHHG